MKSTSRSAKLATAFFPGIVGYLMVLLLSGCGLAMDNEDRLDRAEKAYVEGEYRAAIIDAKDVLLKEPDNLRGRLLLGRASLQINDAASARKELTRAVELGAAFSEVAVDLGRALLALRQFDKVLEDISPDIAGSNNDLLRIYQLRGEALLGLGRPSEARDVFSRVLDSDDNNIEAQIGIVSSYIRERNFLQARATLDQVLTTNAASVALWLESGVLYLQTQNAELAETHFERALGLAVEQGDEPAEARALAGLGDALLAQNKTDAARTVAERLMALSPKGSVAMYLAARVAYIDQDWARAEKLLLELLRRLPDYRPAQLLLGAVHLKNGNLGQAEMYLSAVVAAAPGNADARNLLAQTRLRQKDESAAQELLRPMLEGSTPNTGTLAIAAEASFGAGDFERAADYLRQLVAANPDRPGAQLDLAAMYLMANRVSEAQSILDAVDFGDDEANQYRGDMLSVMSLVRAGDTSAALERAKALEEKWPQNARVFTLIGSVEMLAGDPVAARRNFEEAAKIAPNDVLPIRFLASVDETDGNFAEAAKQYLKIIDIAPNDMPAIMGLARLSSRADDLGTTRHWLEKAVAADPQDFAVRKTLGQLLLAMRDFEAARDLAKDTIGAAPDNADARRLLGHALLNLGEPAAAQEGFEEAILLDPDEPEYRLALARAQIAAGDNDAAQDTVVAAYNHDPENIPIALLLASIKANYGDLDGATKIAKNLERAHPDNSAPLSLQAELLARGGKLSEAARKYEQVLEIDNAARFAARAYQVRKAAGVPDPTLPLTRHLDENPLNTEIRTFLAQVYQVDGNNQMAIREYERVLQTAPDSPVALNNLAWSYFLIDDSRAEETARKAYQMAPENSSIIDTLGWIRVQKGELEDGVSLLRTASDLAPHNLEVKYHLAAGLVKLGKVGEARPILEKILEGEEEFASRNDAEKLLAEL